MDVVAGVLYRVDMLDVLVKGAFDMVSTTSDDDDESEADSIFILFLPIAVFGYSGYLEGFETVLNP